MSLIVVIASCGRKDLLTRTLENLEKQTRPPDQVIVSAPDESHVDRYESSTFELVHVFGALGSAAQRNRALNSLDRLYEVVVFFDDDFVPRDDYLENVISVLRANANWAVVTGRVIYDGIKHGGLPFDEGQKLLQGFPATPGESCSASPRSGAYGCNMAVRGADLGQLRFDERLPLYSWQEDTDFSRRLAGHGSIVEVNHLVGVHLGSQRGRVSGIRFGYSQIANPIYLVRKGTMSLWPAACLMSRNLAANLVRSLRPEPHVDRRGRLKGNAIAISHVLKGRVEPEYILKLQ